MRASSGPCSPRMNVTMPQLGSGTPCTSHRSPATHNPINYPRSAAPRDSKTRSDRTRESPAILLASIPPRTSDHRHGATPNFEWGSLVRLVSWPAHTIAAQQGRLQRRSLFLGIASRPQPSTDKRHAALNRSAPTTMTPAHAGITINSTLTRWRSPCKQNRSNAVVDR